VNLPHEPSNNSPAHQFPPGLEFLASLRQAQQTEDPEARRAILWAFLENARAFSDRLRQHGLDPDRIIIPLQTCLEDLAKAEKEADKAQDKLLHAAADLADASRQQVDNLEAAINAAAEEKPFDPEIQKWKEQIRELRKQYPKLD
jgi:ABC-type transporter Mla subunit MlaD